MKVPLLKAEGLSFRYGEREIFRDLGFDLFPGDILCLLGPNGCGKTTFLKCLNGLHRPAKGDIHVEGRDMRRLRLTERARLIAYVPQEQTPVFSYSVLETVQMGRAPYLGLFSGPGKQDEAIAVRSLAMVNGGHLVNKRVTELSGGEKQLILIARALSQEARILLLDEPTSHLDFGNQALVLSIIRRLARQSGLGVVMTTHFPNHASLVGTKLALMKEGSFIAMGPAEGMLNEEILQSLYGIKVRMARIAGPGKDVYDLVVPVLDEIERLAEKGHSKKRDDPGERGRGLKI